MISITLPSQSSHLVGEINGEPNIEGYSTSVNTRAALRAARNAGRWETYTQPKSPAETPPPDWKTFRLDLLKSKSFRLWSELLPGTWREDLKMAALVGNAEALQDIYDYCKSISIPGLASTAEWQKLADKSNIPVKF